jgi:predicted enzyme related to lactoylglutathione lyase
MSSHDRYLPGVPCWVDTTQPDPAAAAAFYGGLFGWQFEDAAEPDAYGVGRLPGGDAAAVTGIRDGMPPIAMWNTYVWVQSADATAAKAREAGGTVLVEPFEPGPAGRMAVLRDPSGAVISAWEPHDFGGADVVNEHGAVNFNDLATDDHETARAFYGAVFGWETLDMGGGVSMWTLPGYGEFLESINPGTLANNAELGAPEGFADVVASLNPLPADPPGIPPHWGVTFAVDDADAIAERAVQLGGTVLAGPFDAPWVRLAVIRDPQGATFTASTFVPENRDVPAAAPGTAAG